ncbi:phospholipase [Achromobacter sp. GG226]|uniref:phospholipase D-like domain-containing protein n=1 Tax=Verticiella alkaliphila TaxID=2779529 RepID=UPI001C0BB285|nr:phospholipase D-like domain-containing protein [Verticiella sp. GG226]MBU4609467.1 phospholipase [Verticiella sp. GG226]
MDSLTASPAVASARADRLSIVVDAAPYYRAVKEALLQARHSVFLIGWDFDARMKLQPEGATLPGPNRIGPFLSWLARRNPALRIRILKWDMGLFASMARGETPVFIVRWLFGKRVAMKLDHAHPPLSAHHSKILVIDDALAFCGGIDITMGRWDTSEHREEQPSRTTPRGKPLPPWHDATTCASGPVARVLGNLARQRWYNATGEVPDAPPPTPSPWPDSLTPDFTDVAVRVARTQPLYGDNPEIREIERETLKIIAGARRTLYIENQYLTSVMAVDALCARLREDDGPEIVVICPRNADGWLEMKTMDSARTIMLHRLREADRHGRFRIWHPHNEAGTPIYVHAKILIADDEVIKIGSANLNNRSMGFDTECDVIVQACNDAERAQIGRIRGRLVAEHLAIKEGVLHETLAQQSSLIAAIEHLNGRQPKGLTRIEPRALDAVDEALAQSPMADPEGRAGVWRGLSRTRRRRALLKGQTT